MGLEIAHQLGWRMPDAIVYPTGGGTGIIGMHKGFQELLELGWIEGNCPVLRRPGRWLPTHRQGLE